MLHAPLLVDTHVHIHRCFDLEVFFSAAKANFLRSTISLGLPRSTPGCLMLAETPGEDAFSRARDWIADSGNEGWTSDPTDEPISLVGRATDGATIVLVAGRQVITREGVEVLGLGVDQDLPFGCPLEDTIQAVHDAAAIPVVPWGFGKWWLGRGKRILELIADPPVTDLFLGDNAGRPQFARSPRQFSAAAQQRISVLPGTDPLPLRFHQTRAGGYGLVLNGIFDSALPGSGLKDLLRALHGDAPFFGRRDKLPFVVRTQIALRTSSIARRGMPI